MRFLVQHSWGVGFGCGVLVHLFLFLILWNVPGVGPLVLGSGWLLVVAILLPWVVFGVVFGFLSSRY